ncbi:Amidase chyE [Cladobotryum mycophilum]|uniref:Amidase chyE n=1 Tax=Cladobotryum mycophilum TaxID=491253 RepID=A0ABR0SWC4_9HYPO
MCGIVATCHCPRATIPDIKGHERNNELESANEHLNGEPHGRLFGIKAKVYKNIRGASKIGRLISRLTHRRSKTVDLETTMVDGKHDELVDSLKAAIGALKHRGPDGVGVWVSQDGRVGLAHCRLSINDLSPSGSQPLHSDDGAIHAIVNGEIYDHDRLREVCTTQHGYRFKGTSDSEIVVALYKIYGAPAFLQHLRGEFAFVIFDEREGNRRVIAGRDRFGIKPLVWTVFGDKIIFAAEAKAFLALGWKPEWNVHAITDGGWMLDDRTVFQGVRKLMPGHWMEVTDESGVHIRKYWDAEYPDKTKPDSRTTEEMVLGVRHRLTEAIRLRMQADVPVGIYLSGGIDSSVIAGIATQLAREDRVKIGNKQTTQVVCFSVQFPRESGFDESDIADRTAKSLGANIIKVVVDEERLAKDFVNAVHHCEHHVCDLNAVAKFTLSTLAREHGIKVVLTGEGSDEHFAGYPIFPAEFLREPDLGMPESTLAQNHELRMNLQKSASALIKAALHSSSTMEDDDRSSDVIQDNDENTIPKLLLTWHPTKHVFKDWVQNQYNGKWNMVETVWASYSTEVRKDMREKWHPAHTAMYMWNKSTLLNVILSSLGDRAEMAHGVEGRTPFLDHELTEYVNSLPPSTKLKYAPQEEHSSNQVSGHQKLVGSPLQYITEKWILREAAKPFITEELYNRRKVPFLAPVTWPKHGPLQNMFKELLTQEAVENLGFVNYEVIERALDKAFGEKGDPASFRMLCYTGSWVALAGRFGVTSASFEDSSWTC